MKKKQSKFNCDLNGSIMVMSALRYSLGRHTYVPGAVQDWISDNWDSLDSNTKTVIVRDVFEHIYDTNRINNLKLEPMFEYDLQSWENFAIQRYWQLNYDERKSVEQQLLNDKKRVVWYTKQIMPKIYENTK
ncbi:hypothetical protein EB118_07890 [bacterium]|nr:hypothetical protein [bacterium]NDD85612.1 hypothetical protein [bacterium]NDG29999.1 hypothetical protein [bacterium]